MYKNIAIIGGGFFGCAIAKKLTDIGHKCIIYEKRSQILTGTSQANIFRIHRGPHYPRSDETAIQCLEGYSKFCNLFSDCIERQFPNYYFISSEKSNTSLEDFLDFCTRLNIPHDKIPKSDLPSFIDNCDGGVLCKEGTINIFRMQDYYNQILFENSIEAKVNTEIMAIEVKGNHFVLKTEGKNFEADLVINCSFTGMNLGSKTLHQPTMDLVYQKTVCFKCKTYEPIFGITILDGKFPTVFPSFWNENSTQLDCFVLYHVTHSVCRQQNSVQYPKFSPIGSKELKDRYELTLNDVEKFIPKFGNKIGEVKFLIGDRVIHPGVQNTDMRVSEILTFSENYHVVFQGKIDFSLNIADQIASLIS